MAGPLSAQPQVAVSIRPLQLIAAAITDGVSEPALVLDNSQDPHHPSLRPSQRRAMDTAELFLWTGPALETGLDKVIPALTGEVVTVMDLSGLVLHSIDSFKDPHVWLDTHNAVLVARSLADALAAIDTGNASRYRKNLANFETTVAQLEANITSLFELRKIPAFAVYHNGYQYFEKQFGLSHVASFTNNEEVQPAIRRVMAIRQQLIAAGVTCIILGPAQNPTYLDNQLDMGGMRYVTVDVLAHDVAPGRQGYTQFMTGLANAFADCHS